MAHLKKDKSHCVKMHLILSYHWHSEGVPELRFWAFFLFQFKLQHVLALVN